jgi:hypothetical protein
LLGDIIDTASVPGEDLFMRAAAMPAGLTRRRRGLRSAKPEADGRVVASMATMAKVTEVRRRFNIIVDIIINCYFDGMFLAFDFMMRDVVVEVQESECWAETFRQLNPITILLCWLCFIAKVVDLGREREQLV